jgi:hypothetical protein
MAERGTMPRTHDRQRPENCDWKAPLPSQRGGFEEAATSRPRSNAPACQAVLHRTRPIGATCQRNASPDRP